MVMTILENTQKVFAVSFVGYIAETLLVKPRFHVLYKGFFSFSIYFFSHTPSRFPNTFSSLRENQKAINELIDKNKDCL